MDEVSAERGSLERAIRLSVAEGALATVMGSLLGGIFLTGFALSLGASELQIGILAALPFLAHFAQIAGAWRLSQQGTNRKRLCLGPALASRILWIPAFALPVLLSDQPGLATWALVAIVAVSCVLASLAGVAWLSWVRDLIPAPRQIEFFARRHVANTAASLILGLAAGLFLDYWMKSHGAGPGQFVPVFVAAMVCGLLGMPVLAAIPDRQRETPSTVSFRTSFTEAFGRSNYRALLLFYVVWHLAYHLAVPFLSVYMIQSLGLSYGYMMALATLSSVVGLLANGFWQRLSERFGVKPVVFCATLGDGLALLGWLLVGPGNEWLLIPIHLGGLFSAPLAMGPNNLLLKVVPQTNAAPYLAIFNTAIGLTIATAAVAGGAFVQTLSATNLVAAGSGLPLLFLISGVARVASVFLLRYVSEESAYPLVRIIRVLRRRRPVYQPVLSPDLRNEIEPAVLASTAAEPVGSAR